MAGQYFLTDFLVTTDTDNFVFETSIMWDDLTKRQLMGYDYGRGGYFGLNNTGYYEIGGTKTTVKGSDTIYDKLRLFRSKSDDIWSLYVNNTKAGNYHIYEYKEGKMSVGSSISDYACYCKMKYFKIYQDGALKYNLIPAKNSSNVAGMYDTVNDKFYTSTSGTAFVEGPVAEPTNLLDSSLFATSGTKTGLTFTCDKTTGYITINGTATATSYWNPSTQTYTLLVADHKYAMVGCVFDGQNTHWGLLNQRGNGDYGSGAICTVDGSLGKSWGVVWQNGATFNNYKFKPRLYDLTEIFGSGNEPSTVDELKEILPKIFEF